MLNLTEEEIASLPVNKEFSKLVAIEIMGWKVGDGLKGKWWVDQDDNVTFFIDDENYELWAWNPGNNLVQAWTVLNKFPDSNWHKSISNCCYSEGKKWCIILYENLEREDSIIAEHNGEIAESICKAALKTKATDARENHTKEFPEA